MSDTSLKLFNERVERLERSTLAKRMAKPHYNLDYDRMINRQFVSAEGITEDAVDAFVCSIRLLIQSRDGFSIQCLAKNVYTDESVPQELRDRFYAARDRWEKYRDRTSAFKGPRQDSNLKNGFLFDVILYGGVAHSNRDKVEDFELLAKRGAISSLVFASFLHMLNTLFSVVKEIRNANVELLSLRDAEC